MRQTLRALAVWTIFTLGTAFGLGQTWTQITTVPNNVYPGNALLLTDGRVLLQDADESDWWTLTPDKTGSYLNGTWTQVASTTNYGPLYYASQVMPDGRVFVMGGEYDLGSSEVWTNKGYIYDPRKNTWTYQAAPSGWSQMGDTGSVILPNGKLLLMDPFSSQGALFNPPSNTFNVPYGTGKNDQNDEEGLTLLPNGNVLTVDAWNVPYSEIFNTSTATWSSAGRTPVNLTDPSTEEVGPMVLRPDGTVICFGALGQNAIFNTKTSVWTTAPSFPKMNGMYLDCEDAPAVLLPSGNVLVQTSPGAYNSPSVFFEWNGSTLTQVATAPQDAFYEPSYVGTFLVLPTSQILYTGQDGDVELYTPKGTPNPAWAPVITSAPKVVEPGVDYQISGKQFNGLSGASGYGDDEQNETNYPLVRIINDATQDVFYCREHDPSTMAICTGNKIVYTSFQVPEKIESGPSTLQVVTNGIPSPAVKITVDPPLHASAVSVFQGSGGSGSVQDVWALDGSVFSTGSVLSEGCQQAAIEADFTSPINALSGLSVIASVSAGSGTTGTLYLYDWQAKQFVTVGNSALSGSQTQLGFAAPAPFSRYLGPNREIRMVVQAVSSSNGSGRPFALGADFLEVAPY